MSRPGRDPWEPYVDPAEDAASMAGLALAPAIELIAAELRAKHFAERRGESKETTSSKVSKWNSGQYAPRGARRR